ncbi:MAG: bifunctional pyr operon transcriptional regulator/uracil phosphoribosyltransferase PyrR [Candidatus Latescibacter sp.]|nr:bifunctional pyr operon transcriptional regulator/uracil phosphoribosyltransferase PyrR [Candidatus Latescibacter sp.]
MTITSEERIMDAAAMKRALQRMSHEILDRNNGPERLALVGLQTRGVFLARRMAEIIGAIENTTIPVGILDVTMYRDDYRSVMKQPMVKVTSISFEVQGITVVLVDDVFFTGRTVRGALDAIMDFGRPGRVELAVLIDRGRRELPLIADYVGKQVTTQVDEEVRVRMAEGDGVDEVTLVKLSR